MRTHRKRIFWFCLLAYLWSATGLSSFAVLAAVTNDHAAGEVVVMPGQGAEVIFHHVGHRDKHEPMVADAHEAAGQLATDVGHGHSDHVLNLDQEADGNGSFPSAYKFTNLFAAKLFGVAPHVVVTAALAAPDFLPANTTIRNSSIAIVQMTRLRI